MEFQGRPVGPRGLALLVATGVTGAILAAHGWSAHRSPLAAGSLGTGSAPPSAPARSPAAAKPATSSPQASRAAAPGASRAATPGPLLSSEPFATYSYLVWPGTPSAAAQAALTGLSISVHRVGTGISVVAGINGQPAPAAHLYQDGVRVYVVEASLGDDSGNSDYNLGDDGLVVTDAQQRIVQ
jgi:hypothetical protein